MATAVAHKGGRHHNLIRSAKNKASGKYKKQASRTAANKAKRVIQIKLQEARARKRNEARHEWMKPLCWPTDHDKKQSEAEHDEKLAEVLSYGP